MSTLQKTSLVGGAAPFAWNSDEDAQGVLTSQKCENVVMVGP